MKHEQGFVRCCLWLWKRRFVPVFHAPSSHPIAILWRIRHIVKSQRACDQLQWKNLGAFDGKFTTTVPAHGCVLVKIGKSKRMN